MKRSTKGGGSIRYKESKKLWEARYSAGRDPGTGKQIQKSIYGKTKEEVRKLLALKIVEYDSGLYSDPTQMRVKEWAEIWQKDYLNSVKPSTREQYGTNIRNHIIPSLGAIRLSKLTSPMIQNFYNKALKTISPKSVRNIHGILHKMLSQAVKVRYIPINPCDACDPPIVPRKEIKPLTPEQVTLFLQEIRGTVNENMLIVDIFTGMRQSEIIGLTWDCIDFEKGIITIYRQYRKERKYQSKGIYQFSSLKNNKPRTIAPAETVLETLKQVKSEQEKFAEESGELYSNPEGFVFTNHKGKPIPPATIYGNFKRIARKIGCPDARYHDLRHTFATLSLQNGDDIKTVSSNLGHATVAFTLDVYGHVSEQMKKDSAERMEKLIKGTLKGTSPDIMNENPPEPTQNKEPNS